MDDLKYTDRAGLVGWLIEQDLELGIDKKILLHWAALNGDAKAVESLIKRGADSKNALVTNGHTPLHAAAFGSHDYEEKKGSSKTGQPLFGNSSPAVPM